jgi:hypothetical protein
MSRREKPWSWIPTRLKAKNDCAGEGLQQFNRVTDKLHGVTSKNTGIVIHDDIHNSPALDPIFSPLDPVETFTF